MEYTGCKLSPIDIRDYQLKAGMIDISNLPSSFQLQLKQTIKNQAPVQSCVAHAASSILEYHAQGEKIYSTNFIYGLQEDYMPGMYLRDACDILKKYGDCLESECPGNIERPQAHNLFLKQIKKLQVYDNHILSYYNCEDDNAIKYAIFTYGPVLAAINWPTKSSINTNGHLIFKKQNLKQNYHAIMIYGWDEEGFWCLNSYGKEYGLNGCFHINYNDNLIGEAKAIICNISLEKEEEDNHLYRTKAVNSSSINFIYKIINWFKNK